MDLSVKDIRIRFISSSVLSLLFNLVFITCIYVVNNFSLSYPAWHTYLLLWGFILLLANSCFSTVAIKQLFMHLKVFDVAYNKNNGFFYALLSHKNLVFFSASFGLGVCQTWTLLQIISCNTDVDSSAISCSLWLLAYGGFIGYLFAVTSVTENLLTLTFDNSSISLFEIFSLVIRKNCFRTVGRMIYFIVLCCFIDLFIFQQLPFSSGLFSHFGLKRLFELYVIGFYIYASWSASLILLQNTLTQILFPNAVNQNIAHNSGCHLVNDFLSASSNGLLHHISLGKLANAVASNENTRAQIFNVTDLNGQMILWQRVSKACLEKLDIFLEGLHKTNKQLTVNSPAYLGKCGKLDQWHDVHLLPKPMFGLLNNKPNQQQNMDAFEIKRFANQVLEFATNLPGCRMLLQEIPFAPTWRLFSSGGACNLVGAARDPATIHSTEKSARQSGQAVIWCTEIICCLTLASYTEDSLGSVQHDLGRILSTLDEVFEAIELHFKLADLTLPQTTENGCSTDVNVRNNQINHRTGANELSLDSNEASYYQFASDPNLPWRVHATFRWALLCCLQQFGDHLRTIQMDVKRRRKLEEFWKSLPAISSSA